MNSLEARFQSEVGKVYKSAWKLIDQETINVFGKVTDDEQAIHMDPEYAKNSLYGGIVAHGFLTASLIPGMIFKTREPWPEEQSLIIVGMENCRFRSPVYVNDSVRLVYELDKFKKHRIPNSYMTFDKGYIEIKNKSKPAVTVSWRKLQVFKG